MNQDSKKTPRAAVDKLRFSKDDAEHTRAVRCLSANDNADRWGVKCLSALLSTLLSYLIAGKLYPPEIQIQIDETFA